MLQNREIIEVVLPTYTAQTTLAVDLSAYGYVAANCANMTPVILCKRASNGVRASSVSAASISSTTLTLTKGSETWVTGDIFTVALITGRQPVTGTLS